MRAITFLQNLISEIGLNETSLNSIRITTNRMQSGFFVRYEFDFFNQVFDRKLSNILFNNIRSDFDNLFVRNSDPAGFRHVKIDEIRALNVDPQILGAGFAIELSDDGYRFDLNKIKNALTAKTFYGLDKSIRRHVPANKIKIFFGAGTYQAIDINSGEGHFVQGVEAGRPFCYAIDQSKQLKFSYLKNGILFEKKISLEKYLTQVVKNELDRFKIKTKFGLQIHALFEFEKFIPDAPLSDWTFLLNLIDSNLHNEITLFRTQQVSRLSARTGSIYQRKKVSFNGVDLGVEPKNETETVLLFERAFPYIKGRLPEGFFIRLLDYSPRDIDAVCEFSPSAAVPSKIALVEFEYDLKSFFEHGHDLRQVNLIVCYKMDNINFPYHCYGSTYELEDQGNITILKDAADMQAQAFCLVLNKYLTLSNHL